MATTKFQNNVRTRLYKKNYQGFSQSDFLEAAKIIGCDDLDNPTHEQIKAGVQYLIDKHNQSLALTESEATQRTENSTAITNQQKEQLISVQAESLGIELSESEITDISQTVSDSFTDFVSAVETINSSIKDYAQSKFDEVEQKIDSSNSNLRDYINKRTTSLQRKSVEGAITTKEVLEQKSSSLKSFFKSLSAAFKTQ
ncbi:MAG: hypothetical protein HC836_46560 [Richelia sp. RM2_1_2]|nr:hypothetical protein [Richelia sp. SM1_7_0]NJO27780.1 hypothetical protein [Richelia sp. SL_2_1]NJO65300.1 hypothetical protein [Richelia sp. RM2_1_2]